MVAMSVDSEQAHQQSGLSKGLLCPDRLILAAATTASS